MKKEALQYLAELLVGYKFQYYTGEASPEFVEELTVSDQYYDALEDSYNAASDKPLEVGFDPTTPLAKKIIEKYGIK